MKCVIDQKSSYEIWILKALAVMSIFFAHMPLNYAEQGGLFPLLYQLIGMIGVPTFFFFSGFLYKPGNWSKKNTEIIYSPFFMGYHDLFYSFA